MKVTIEKVPEGVKLSLTYDTAKKPMVITLTPGQVESFIALVRGAMQSTNFKFEYQV